MTLLSDISEYLPDKNYYKLKETNTKLNEGYTTIEPKRKAIIEISNCPKSFFRKNNRPRRVCFCTDASNVVHNPGGTINPIIEKSATVEPSFEWSGEKQVVEIVKRIDLWPEMSQDDYVCRPIDKKLNLENS
ncbi:uncharacterized protein VICG_00162 [Vittaforma corneae ATCC 50505]|uniref:Uncharacterized protein n=1 Tax=Vittaforma corneae (strain ATCC 50505) TaxID=993615 RepID=L2GR92_VITCO|nr:uncharacterized protein VICG_00162 [Vittaforma corneae ATCC 50505]ELA42847.1 hypothetical protein VICG_00162 [Vittaforma corneae ATCC 50505]